jgi:ABC-2 type transport system ATP-binding protein
MAFLSCSSLTKKFGDTIAIDGITFGVSEGEVIGLVGPDGAGKTTLMRLLVGLLDATSGSITIDKSIGYMPQKFGLYEDLTVQENLNLYADLKGITDREKTFATLLEFTNLAPFTDRLAGKLSGGMKQKLGLACALMGTPKVLLLDEPGVGVDPVSRRDLMKMVRNLSASMTILWSTSYLDEAENFDKVILLNKGKILYFGEPKELTKTLEGNVFHANIGHNRRLLRAILESQQKVVDAVLEGKNVRVVL